jgi:hypothetical protein
MSKKSKTFQQIMEEARANAKFKFKQTYGGTGRGKTQAAEDWVSGHAYTFSGSPDGVLGNNMVHVGGSLWAPSGWNNYLKTGNFKGCRPIVPKRGKFNMSAFEPINFEMV